MFEGLGWNRNIYLLRSGCSIAIRRLAHHPSYYSQFTIRQPSITIHSLLPKKFTANYKKLFIILKSVVSPQTFLQDEVYCIVFCLTETTATHFGRYQCEHGAADTRRFFI